jgi:hypothetical protein
MSSDQAAGKTELWSLLAVRVLNPSKRLSSPGKNAAQSKNSSRMKRTYRKLQTEFNVLLTGGRQFLRQGCTISQMN